MIKGVSKQAVPYVLEEDRASALDEQTVFYIRPKTGHDNNKTLRRYAQASKTSRKGVQELNVSRLDAADREDFLGVVEKVENYIFPDEHKLNENNKVWTEITDETILIEVAATLSADHLAEVLEVSNNISKLSEGAKKTSN